MITMLDLLTHLERIAVMTRKRTELVQDKGVHWIHGVQVERTNPAELNGGQSFPTVQLTITGSTLDADDWSMIVGMPASVLAELLEKIY